MSINQKVNENHARKIVNGPSADRLFDACRYAYDSKVKIPVHFGIVAGNSMSKDHPGCAAILAHSCDLILTSIEHEDGSGNSFNIGGYCKGFKVGPYDEPKYADCRVKIFYNSKSRNGFINFFV